MSAFRPISPHHALQLLDAAEIGTDSSRLLADLAMAGVVKGYARLVESEGPGVGRTEVRDAKIDRHLWRRIVTEQKVSEVYASGSVHLGGTGERVARVSVIGIRFDATTVQAAAAQHGKIEMAPKPAGTVPESKVAPAEELRQEPDAFQPERRSIDPAAVTYSIDEAAIALSVSRGTINKMIKSERLQSFRIGNRRVVVGDSVRILIG